MALELVLVLVLVLELHLSKCHLLSMLQPKDLVQVLVRMLCYCTNL